MTGSDPRRPGEPHGSLKHPGRWLWLFLLIPVLLGLGRIRVDVEVLDLLPGELPVVKGLKLYQQHFANARQLLITVQASDAEQAEKAAQQIAEELRRRTGLVDSVIWQPPWLEHPEQAAELIAYIWYNQSPAELRELTNRLAPEKLDAALRETRERLTTSLSPEEIARSGYDPFGLTRLPEKAADAAPTFGEGQRAFASDDGSFRIIFLQAHDELRTYRECALWLSSIKEAANRALTASEPAGEAQVALGFTGRPAFVAEVASGMEHDTTFSVAGTAAIIAVLFWLAHRRVKPMLWLLTLLGLILGCTFALGGLIFGTINVISMGFAAILLGLAVDYAVVHYQEALAHPQLSIPQVRHAIAPSIFWAAVTTITAFLMLNFGGLPGLAQLGTLVGLGVALAAGIMIFEFLPPLFPDRREPRPENEPLIQGPSKREKLKLRTGPVFCITLGVTFGTIVTTLFGLPRVESTADALRPRKSAAYAALEQVQNLMNQKRDPLWVIVEGASVREVGRKLEAVQEGLSRSITNQLIEEFTLPTPLWPREDFQTENRLAARQIAAQRETLRSAALTNGFAESAFAFTERILDTWQLASSQTNVFWPSNPMSQWIFEKFAARNRTNFFALGLVYPATNSASGSDAWLARLAGEFPHEKVLLSGWSLLGKAIFSRVKAHLWRVLAPMICLVLLSLWLAFRRLPEMVLSLAVLLLSGLVLMAVMRIFGWSWNLLNLMGLPLILGTGVDYSIFMQLALRRFGGDLDLAYRSVGRALLLCGATAVAGFGSLSWSSNTGMASLGQVCAVGVGSNMLIAVFLLPTWWDRMVDSER